MSSPRIRQQMHQLPEQLVKLGKYSVSPLKAVRWTGQDVDNNDAVVIDLDSGTWATNQKRIIVVGEAGESILPESMRTQSHSKGNFLEGGIRFHVYMESPDAVIAATDGLDEFMRHTLHQLRGMMGAPVQLHLTANGTEPTVEGVEGAGSTAANTASEWMLPSSLAYPGGI